MFTGFYRKGSSVNRTVNEDAGKYGGSGKAIELYVVKGTAYATKGYPKAALRAPRDAPRPSLPPGQGLHDGPGR